MSHKQLMQTMAPLLEKAAGLCQRGFEWSEAAAGICPLQNRQENMAMDLYTQQPLEREPGIYISLSDLKTLEQARLSGHLEGPWKDYFADDQPVMFKQGYMPDHYRGEDPVFTIDQIEGMKMPKEPETFIHNEYILETMVQKPLEWMEENGISCIFSINCLQPVTRFDGERIAITMPEPYLYEDLNQFEADLWHEIGHALLYNYPFKAPVSREMQEKLAQCISIYARENLERPSMIDGIDTAYLMAHLEESWNKGGLQQVRHDLAACSVTAQKIAAQAAPSYIKEVKNNLDILRKETRMPKSVQKVIKAIEASRMPAKEAADLSQRAIRILNDRELNSRQKQNALAMISSSLIKEQQRSYV